jgi:ketosteroid isomerase-like protein
MHARVTLLTLLMLGLGSTACGPSVQEAGLLSHEDVAAIEAFVEAHVQAGLAGDWEAWYSHYADDAVAMWPNRPAVEGLEALREVKLNRALEYELSPVEIDGRGDLAFVRATFSLLLDYEGAVTNEGKLVWILRRQSDGSWLIAINISNSDLPLPDEGSGT